MESSTRRSSRQALPITRSSSTRSAPVAAGSRDPASSKAPAGSVNARVSRSATSSARAPSLQVSRRASRQQRPMPLAIADVADPLATGERCAHTRRGEARAAPTRPARRLGERLTVPVAPAATALTQLPQLENLIPGPTGRRSDGEHAGCERAVDGTDLVPGTWRAHQVDGEGGRLHGGLVSPRRRKVLDVTAVVASGGDVHRANASGARRHVGEVAQESTECEAAADAGASGTAERQVHDVERPSRRPSPTARRPDRSRR